MEGRVAILLRNESDRTVEARDDGQISDIHQITTLIVNLYMIGKPKESGAADWVLVDTGIGRFANKIIGAAEERFGVGSKPKAIILTHGHFDHVGTVMELADHWEVPVFAHSLELPYLTGRKDYPPADPTVGGGLMAGISPLYPNEGIDLGGRIEPLPSDGSVPSLPEWRWIHTPGHTPGHVSLFREKDRTVIAGDAFITVKQESALSVMTQTREIHGPPAYFTTDWQQARESVRKLAALNPATAYTGHGQPMFGRDLAGQLETLARDFDRLAIPDQGRYVHQ